MRSAVGVSLVIQGLAYLVDGHDLGFVTLVIAVLEVASGALLLVGYLTPFAAVLAGLFFIGSALSWFPAPNTEWFEAGLTTALATIIAIAVVCLGPGAFSLDARLFGRREIIVRDASHPS